jgi:hypothetical protein
MPDFTPIFQAAGQQYGVDPTILRAIAMKESSMNPTAVNPASGASGLMGFTPATAKSYGINPLDPQQAIPAAAKMFAENLQRFNGNVDDAVAAHFAGPNQKLWGPKTSQYVDQVSGIFGQMKQGAPAAAQEAPQGADPVLAMAQSIQKGGSPSAAPSAAPTAATSDPILAMAQGIASGKAPAAQAPVVSPSSASSGAQQAQAAQAQDLAAGGASPDTLSQLGQIARAGAHGVGSMFNNAANFAERHLPFFPADVAARDTATQAQADQQFSQTASPGEKAAAFVAPMLLPMSGAMAPGNAVRAGITRLTPNAVAPVGRAIGAALGNAVNGGIMATGAPIDPNQPVGPQDARNVGTGAALGVAMPAAAAAGKAIGSNLYGAVRPIINPQGVVGEGLANAVGDEAGNVAQNIASAPQFVRGSMPTTAQVAGSPVLLQTEKAAGNVPQIRTALEQRALDNNEARWAAINGVAGTPADIQAAERARLTATAPLYDNVNNSWAAADAPLTSLFSRPAVKSAMDDAVRLAADEGVSLSFPTASKQPISGQALDYLGRAMRDQIGVAQRNGSAQQVRALTKTANAIDQWGSQNIPAIDAARAAYAQASVPVNTMSAGQEVANAMSSLGRSANVNQQPVLQAGPYATALARALKNQEFGIEPSAQDALENVGRDLQRATISNSLKSPGSDTAYNIAADGWLARNLYGPSYGGSTNLGRLLAGGAVAAAGHPWAGLGVASGIGKVGQMVGNRLNAQLSDFLLNPEALLPYLNARAAGPVNGSQQALAAALRRQVVPAAVVGVSRRSLVNAP